MMIDDDDDDNDNDNDVTMYKTFQDENSKKEFVTSGHKVFKLNSIPYN